MLENTNVTLIFNGQANQVSFQTQILRNLPENIFLSIFNNHRYEIQSNISEEVFQSFVNYISSGELPIIDRDNYDDFNQLNQEFCITQLAEFLQSKRKEFGEYLINIINLKKSSNSNKSQIELSIATN